MDIGTRRTACTFVPPYLLERVGAVDALVLDEQLRAAPQRTRPQAAHRPARAGRRRRGLDGPRRRQRDPAPGSPGPLRRPAAHRRRRRRRGRRRRSRRRCRCSPRASRAHSYDGAGAPVTHHRPLRPATTTTPSGTAPSWSSVTVTARSSSASPRAPTCWPTSSGTRSPSTPPALVYRDQSGALNESVSDVFAACFKQHLAGESAADGDWLIGEGIFVAGINARALRDMAAPGTAYDDPTLGADPQVGHMDDFIETTDDNGGVHLNSGIPNRAFQLAATAIGGTSLEGAGQIWYAALTSGDAHADRRLRGLRGGHHRGGRRARGGACTSAWRAGGRDARAHGRRPCRARPKPASRGWSGSRASGGFAGRTEEGVVSLDEADDGRAGPGGTHRPRRCGGRRCGVQADARHVRLHVPGRRRRSGHAARSRRCRATCTSWPTLVLRRDR